MDGMLSIWTGVCEWEKGKSVASLFVRLTGVREGKLMVFIYRVCEWREGGTNIVAKVRLTGAYAKRKAEGNNVTQLEKCKIH